MPGTDENSYIVEIRIMDCFTCASHYERQRRKASHPILRTASQHRCQNFARAK